MTRATEYYCILHLENESWQTGTLISGKGHIVSAAHGLKASGFAEGGSVTIEFLDGQKAKARILELKYEKEAWVDFSILQIEGSPAGALAKRGWMPLSLRSSWRGRSAQISGFRSAIPEALTHIDCKVVDYAVLKGLAGYSSLQLSSQSGANVSGFSGALVKVSGKEIGFALQFGQARDRSALFAIPIGRIAKNSRLLLSIIDDKSSVIHLEQVFGLTRKRGRELRRWALITVPEAGEGEGVYNRIRLEWYGCLDKIRRGLGALSWVKPGRMIDFDTYRRSVWDSSIDSEARTALDLVLSEEEEIRQPVGDFRAIVDLAASVGPPQTSSWKESYSYFVSIDFRHKEDELRGSEFVDLEISIAPRERVDAAKAILNVLGALALDIMVFCAFPVLEEIYPSPSERRGFSRAKVEFARSKGLKAWGLDVPEDAEYIPLAALASRNILSDPSWDTLGSLWREFFDNHLFLDARQTLGELGEEGGISSSELKAWVESRTGRVNQINEKALLLSLANSGLKKGEIGAVAMLIRKPARRSIKDAVAQRFGRSEYRHINEVRVFKVKDVGHLGQYAPFVQLVFFRYAGS